MTSAARRAQLVDLGVELLRTRPLDQLSLEDVATAAGISRALPFHYFATRADFLVAVVSASSDRLLAATDTDPALDPAERVRLGLLGYIDYIEANAESYIALVRGAAGADEGLVAVFDSTREALVGRILAGLGKDPGHHLIRLAARGWLGMVEEVTVSWLRSPEVDRAELVWLLNESLARIITAVADRREQTPFGIQESG